MTARRTWIISLVAVVLVACNAVQMLGTPTFTLVRPNEFGSPDFRIRVYDASGLVVRVVLNEGAGEINGDVTAYPQSSEARVAWAGDSCSHDPWLYVWGTAEYLQFGLHPTTDLVGTPPPTGPNEPVLEAEDAAASPRPFECPHTGISFGVTLTLSKPVTQDHLHITVVL